MLNASSNSKITACCRSSAHQYLFKCEGRTVGFLQQRPQRYYHLGLYYTRRDRSHHQFQYRYQRRKIRASSVIQV